MYRTMCYVEDLSGRESLEYISSVFCLNPNLPGGGGGHYGPPPVVFLTVRLYHSKFRVLLSLLFPLVSPAHFDTKFTPGVPTVRLLWCNNRSTVTQKVYFCTYLNVSI